LRRMPVAALGAIPNRRKLVGWVNVATVVEKPSPSSVATYFDWKVIPNRLHRETQFGSAVLELTFAEIRPNHERCFQITPWASYAAVGLPESSPKVCGMHAAPAEAGSDQTKPRFRFGPNRAMQRLHSPSLPRA